MFKIKNNYLSVEGIKFLLPQNFYIDIDGMEDVHPDGLRLINPEKDCSIVFMTKDEEYDSLIVTLLETFIDPVLGIGIADNMFEENETGEIWIEEPKIKEKNGLIFADVKYHSRRAYYYRMHFERIIGCKRRFEVLFEVLKEKNTDIETVLNRKSMKEFCESFELDD